MAAFFIKSDRATVVAGNKSRGHSANFLLFFWLDCQPWSCFGKPFPVTSGRAVAADRRLLGEVFLKVSILVSTSPVDTSVVYISTDSFKCPPNPSLIIRINVDNRISLALFSMREI